MAGAHKNELVRITNDDYGIIVKIIHPDYTARRIIQKDKNQNLFIHNFKIWKFNDKLIGLGAATINSQILTGSKYKVKYLYALAERDDVLGFNGYYTWAAYGFDGVTLKAVNKYPKNTSIQSILKTTNGQKIWKEKGNTFEASFSLTKDSNNIILFHKYLRRKGYAK